MKNLLILTIILAIAGSAAAQSPKMAEQSKPKPATRAPASAPSAVDGKFPILSSHIKSLGTIGRYEIASAKVRGLDTPNVTALLALDKETGQLAVLASGNAPGLGVAIVNGASSVGGSFVFGAKIRPDRTSVSNNSDSDSDADADSDSYSRSEGGDAVSVSSVKNHNSVRNSNTSVNSNINANSNQQSQGQLQGQQQGQVQGQSQSNKNHNKTTKAPKKSGKH